MELQTAPLVISRSGDVVFTITSTCELKEVYVKTKHQVNTRVTQI